MPNDSGATYTGPTIVLNPGAGAQTYSGSSRYPSPVPILLNASLTSSNYRPGSIATYSILFNTTLSLIPAGSSIEI